MIDNSNDETNFPHELILNNSQVLRLRKTSANGSSGNTKLSKTKFHKIGQSGDFLGRLLGPLPKTSLPLMKNVLNPSTECFLISLGLKAAA